MTEADVYGPFGEGKRLEAEQEYEELKRKLEAPPVFRGFVVEWLHPDASASVYKSMSASSKEDGWLFLGDREGQEVWINMAQVRQVKSWIEK